MVLNLSREFGRESGFDKPLEFFPECFVAEKVIDALGDAFADIRDYGEFFERCRFKFLERPEMPR